MLEIYKRLCQLQMETVGASFIMGFSPRKDKYYVSLKSIKKRFDANDPISAIEMAALYIENNRVINEGVGYPVYRMDNDKF